MVLKAYMADLPALSGRSGDPRRKISLKASGTLSSGAATDVIVHNISATGMLIECRHTLAISESLEIDLPGAEETRAKVVWMSGRLHGCQFIKPVSKAVLSGAQLRSAAVQEMDAPSARDNMVAGEPFGVRLQRLRKERGLTLDQVASEMAVSKPTVWAWEQGRARPVQDRIELLAKVLGPSSHVLLMGRADDGLGELLDRSKRHIAVAYGTKPDNVRIMIEL